MDRQQCTVAVNMMIFELGRFVARIKR